MTTSCKPYSEIIKQPRSTTHPNLDANVIVIGAGIAGASIAHGCASTDPNCQVLVLEQYTKHYDDTSSKTDTSDKIHVHHGSSRGGPRRIGTIGGEERAMRAWHAWKDLNDTCQERALWDVSGEVYLIKLWPMGWIFLVLTGLWYVYNVYLTSNTAAIPKGFKILWTNQALEDKVGPKQGFQKGCWSGCVGIFYEDAAALHTGRILNHMLKESKNLKVKNGIQVTKIELEEDQQGSSDPKIVKVTAVDSSKNNLQVTFRCNHLVMACGGWAGDLLKKGFNHSHDASSKDGDIPDAVANDETSFDPANVHTKIETFTCPVYRVNSSKGLDSVNAPPPPFSIESKCPIFSSIRDLAYGFPIHHQDCVDHGHQDMILCIRPFSASHESTNPDDQTVSEEHQSKVATFVQDCCVEGSLSYSHCYTCRYPKLSLDGGKKFQTVFDFVPGSNRQIVLHAGLDGYSFKFGSLFGTEFLELLERGTPPKGLEWPQTRAKKNESNILVRIFRGTVVKLIEQTSQSKEESKED